MRLLNAIAALACGSILTCEAAGAQSFPSLRNAPYLDNSSWYATSIDGGATPYRIYQVGAGHCGYRLQFNRVRFFDFHANAWLAAHALNPVNSPTNAAPRDPREFMVSGSQIEGIAVQMTTPNCRDLPASSDSDAAQFDIDSDFGTRYWATNVTDPSRAPAYGVVPGQWGLSEDNREIRFVGQIGNMGDTSANQQRIRIRVDRLENPTRGRVFIESRRGSQWQIDTTIEIARYTQSGGILGEPVLGRPDYQGTSLLTGLEHTPYRPRPR